MITRSTKSLKTDELLCLSNCLKIADDCCMNDDRQFHNCIGVSRQFAKFIKSETSKELHIRADAYDDPEPWVESPTLSDMSNNVISKLKFEELLCFVNCISVTFKTHENESEFHTLVGVPMNFARVFKAALELELSRRTDKSVQ